MSTKHGCCADPCMAPPVAKKVNGEVMTSSPGPISKAMSAMRRASVPDEKPHGCVAAVFAISFSSSSTLAPKINCLLSNTLHRGQNVIAMGGRNWAVEIPVTEHGKWLRSSWVSFYFKKLKPSPFYINRTAPTTASLRFLSVGEEDVIFANEVAKTGQ